MFPEYHQLVDGRRSEELQAHALDMALIPRLAMVLLLEKVMEKLEDLLVVNYIPGMSVPSDSFMSSAAQGGSVLACQLMGCDVTVLDIEGHVL